MLFQQQTVFTIRESKAIECNIRESFRQRKNSFAARITNRQTDPTTGFGESQSIAPNTNQDGSDNP